MRRFILVALLFLAQLAGAADLVRVEMGVAVADFDPADLHTYKIARQTHEFHGDDGNIIFVTYWRFEPEDVGVQVFEMYLIPPRGEVERAGYTFTVPAGWVGEIKPTFWHFALTPAKAGQRAGEWKVYFLFNGRLKGETAFLLSP